MLARPWRRLYSKKPDHAFTRRLEELEEAIIKREDSLLGEKFQSLIDKDQSLAKIQSRIEQNAFEHKNQGAIYASKIPSYASKQSRDIAFSEPWKGEENIQDTTLRMVLDKHKPMRSQKEAQKLGRVKDTVLDFRINKPAHGQGQDEDSTFRAIYQERFTPIGSFDKIKTIADARIDEAIRQGQFKNIPRDKKLAVEVKPYVDRTEHHLNNMLIKQNIVPPWIEKQGGVNAEITSFRYESASKWQSHVKNFYNEDHDQMFKEFVKRWRTIFETKMNLVNNAIRTYNLQAPLSTQKFYLLIDKELERCRSEVNVGQLLQEYRRQLQNELEEKERQRQQKKLSWKFW